MADPVLIAEDDPMNRELLAKVLRGAGFEVHETADGAAALRAYRPGKFVAVLTDWMMPRIDGLALIQKIRALDPDPPPLLMITALGDAASRQKALGSGADGFVAKPYRPVDIRDELTRCLSIHGEELAPVAFRPRAPRRTAPPFGAVAIAPSTGGPETVKKALADLKPMPGSLT